MEKPTVHYAAEYLLNPVHPITVDLVGCGGSGSMMLSALARINTTLIALGRMGLQVTAYDDDIVDTPNIGRQLFTANDLGVNKAICLVTRFNRCYGTSWKAVPERYEYNPKTNIIITCTDNIASRKYISKELNAKRKDSNYGTDREHIAYYWLDLGNGQKTGQVILGSRTITQPKSAKYHTVNHLMTVDELFHLNKKDEKESGPSCSLAEALSKQDLFINSTLTQYAGDLLWKLLHEGILTYQGVFVNLETMQTRPVVLKKEEKEI